MMKKILLIFCLILLCGTTCLSADEQNVGEGTPKLYVNENFGFTFMYPETWTIDDEIIEDKDGRIAQVSLLTPAFLDEKGNTTNVTFSLSAEKVSSGLRLKKYMDGVFKNTPKYKRSGRVTLNTGGVIDQFVVKHRGKKCYGEEAFSVKDGIGYYISLTADSLSSYESTKEYFYQILGTLELGG